MPIPLFEFKRLSEFTSVTNTAVGVADSSTTILSANANRKYALIVNDSDTVIYLALGAAAAVNSGIRLNAGGGAYEINWTNLYKGAIYGIHAVAGVTKTVTVVEGT